MNHAKLHFVLGLQLVELRSEDGGIVRLREIRRRGRSPDRYVAGLGDLPQG